MKSTAIAADSIFKKSNLIRKPAVLARIGLSDTSLWRRVRDGGFPAPIKISTNAVAWLESDVDEWIEQKVANAKHKVAAQVPPCAPPTNDDDPGRPAGAKRAVRHVDPAAG